jgi:hypothetical protein
MKIDPAIAMLTKDCIERFRDPEQPRPAYQEDTDYVYITPNRHYIVRLEKAQIEINLERCNEGDHNFPRFPWDPKTLQLLAGTGIIEKDGCWSYAKFQGPDFVVYISEKYTKPFYAFYGTAPTSPILAISKQGISAVIAPINWPKSKEE